MRFRSQLSELLSASEASQLKGKLIISLDREMHTTTSPEFPAKGQNEPTPSVLF